MSLVGMLVVRTIPVPYPDSSFNWLVPDVFTTPRVNPTREVWQHMAFEEQREYECVDCGRRETVGDALVSTCPYCGGEMRNVELIQ